VEAPVTTRVALLQALRDGPGYGRELIRRVGRMTEGALRLTPGRVYPALKALAADRLIVPRRVSPGGTRGARSRTYYDLTPRGVGVSTQERRLLAAIVRRGVRPPSPDAAERARMAARILEAEELAETGFELDRAMRQAR
jgi:DNA-binding PadR family transcriptional regulator